MKSFFGYRRNVIHFLAELQNRAKAYLTCVRGLGLAEVNRLSLHSAIQSCADQSGK